MALRSAVLGKGFRETVPLPVFWMSCDSGPFHVLPDLEASVWLAVLWSLHLPHGWCQEGMGSCTETLGKAVSSEAPKEEVGHSRNIRDKKGLLEQGMALSERRGTEELTIMRVGL